MASGRQCGFNPDLKQSRKSLQAFLFTAAKQLEAASGQMTDRRAGRLVEWLHVDSVA